MPQQLSPWLEGAYGWDFGESNWNTGIDQNQLKFSFMFDRNVDGVVASLPAAVNGQAYFLTTDNRLYFAVGTTWFSTPTPKWFQFAVRSTGVTYQFNGSSAVQIDTPAELDARLDGVEVTVASLGTAAFEDIEFFATQAGLDIVEGSSQAYTDALRQDLADTTGSALVGHAAGTVSEALVADAAAIAALESVVSEYIRPSDFGAIGDGVVDDTAAVLSSVSDGRPVYWGDSSLTYRVTSAITASPLSLCWKSNGATIFMDPAAHVAHVLRIDVDGVSKGHQVQGILNIDANQLANVGFYMTNSGAGTQPRDFPSVLLEDVRVSNIYRATTAFANGDGMLLVGGWNQVVLNRCHAVNNAMAAGADIISVQGVSGITVARDNTLMTSPYQIVIQDCFIDRVYSEDPAVDYDQDGIRVFSRYQDFITTPQESSFVIRGGVIRNSRNRSVKSQMQWGVIDGLKIIRTAEANTSTTGISRSDDIDFQVGGGKILNLEAHYDSYLANGIARYTTPDETGSTTTGLQIDNVTIVINSVTPVMPALFTCAAASASANNTWRCNLSNLQVRGLARYNRVFEGRTGTGSGTRSTAILTNVIAEPAQHFTFITGDGRVNISIVGCTHAVNSFSATIPMTNVTVDNTFRVQAVGVYNIV
jgi:hypothetical protein